jgi:Tol biopolymer transport system component/DNA-binding winged helix-turn-helix (wHTH) protein
MLTLIAMTSNAATQSRVNFGLFEADLKSGELWKAGYRVKLQSLPFKILTVLLENAGEVVSREELQARVWGPDVIVDFEHSLSSAIKKLREALGDAADNPRFIETLARRGYRFIAPVGEVEDPVHSVSDPSSKPAGEALPSGNPGSLPAAPASLASISGRWAFYLIVVLSFGCGAALAMAAVRLWDARSPQQTVPRISQITHEGRVYSSVDIEFEALPASVTDGARLFTSSVEDGHDVLSQVSLSTGEIQILRLPNEIASPEIDNISPDGTKLLVRSHLSPASEEPLWVVPVDGGSAFRVSSVQAHDATWMPEGNSILYASGNQLAVVSLESGKSTAFATIPGRAFWLRWSPDAKLLRFTIIDPVDHTASLWEIAGSRSAPRPVLEDSRTSKECCGVWTSDGRSFVFQATSDGRNDLWKLSGSSRGTPVRITNGPLNYEAPAAGRNGQIFFVGHDYRSRVDKYDAQQQQFTPLRNFLAQADRVSFSRDRKRVVWIDSAGLLWRANVDGSDKVQLTPESLRVFMATWSPDGNQLALMGRREGQPWQIFLLSANGGSPERLMSQDLNVADPSFAPDGKSLVFGGVPDLMGQGHTPRSLEILELASNRTKEIAHSQGLFSPRWSPDGRYIAALTLDQQKLMLYDVAARSWKTLATTSAADPVWSPDSKTLYFHAYMAPMGPICKISVPDGRMEEVASLKNFPAGTTSRYFFAGLTPENVPIAHAEIDSSNLYTIDLNPH